MFYSSQAEALRACLRDKLEFSATDVGGGWLIFGAAEADLGIHPTKEGGPPSGTSDISFYCGDIQETVRELRARGVEFRQPVEDHGYGPVTFFRVPATSRCSSTSRSTQHRADVDCAMALIFPPG